jgi:hypothetical protein
MVNSLNNRVGKLENMPEQPRNEVVLHLRTGRVFRFDGDFLQFLIAAGHAVHNFYHGPGRPLPELGFDPDGDPSKPEILRALENCIGYDEGSRVVSLALATIPWSYFFAADLERLGPEQYHKKYGWPVLPTKQQEVVH